MTDTFTYPELPDSFLFEDEIRAVLRSCSVPYTVYSFTLPDGSVLFRRYTHTVDDDGIKSRVTEHTKPDGSPFYGDAVQLLYSILESGTHVLVNGKDITTETL